MVQGVDEEMRLPLQLRRTFQH